MVKHFFFFVKNPFASKSLYGKFASQKTCAKKENKKIVFLRSAEGGRDILDFLRQKGAFVKDIQIYKVEIKDTEEEKELFSEFVTYNPDYIIFTSSLTFKTFLGLARKFGLQENIFEVLEHAKIAAIGDLTAETICEAGMKVDLVAGKSTFEGVLKEITSKTFS